MTATPTGLARQLAGDPFDDRLVDRIVPSVSEQTWSAHDYRTFLEALAEAGGPKAPAARRIAGWLFRRAEDALAGTTGWEPAVERLVARHGLVDETAVACLHLLRGSSDPAALDRWVTLVAQHAPESPALLAPLFEPWFRDPNTARRLFPAVLRLLHRPELAGAVLDLANFLARQAPDKPHPAQDRRPELVALLGNLVQRLQRLEAGSDPVSETEKVRQVGESSALVVALCDALALMRATDAIGKLYQALEVRHRRIQVEAAAALARLGDATGRKKLAELAAEPVVRLFAVEYATEAGCPEAIDEAYRTAEAIAEAKLAMFLAQPQQVGVPPSHIEAVDERTLPWPGMEEPVRCFLFRFEYHRGETGWSRIALVGPGVHVTQSDVADLPPDDIYALFIGADAVHDEIAGWEVHEWTVDHRTEIARWERRLRDEGFDAIQPVLLERFFGAWGLIARVVRNDVPGIVWIDAAGPHWFPEKGPRPLTWQDVYAIAKGRRLLEALSR